MIITRHCSLFLSIVHLFYDHKCFLQIFFCFEIFSRRPQHISKTYVGKCFSILVTNFFGNRNCFLVIFYSLAMLTKRMKHPSQVSITESFFHPVANILRNLKCFFVVFISLGIDHQETEAHFLGLSKIQRLLPPYRHIYWSTKVLFRNNL